ncbi:fructosamine kinase family protein [Williamsia sterculiae]|uniref:Fructosamine-3-kinase n=1 Tax=Williamsia sterculiae TaxID=1344003 RepID=A0A1N7FUH0_9NOCA|nr:fructosamine kinase family protein [Williamsia sterculiae]SIS03907.1 Fructosamine-3-kinase [Williamsia sterculiae]
MSAGDAFRKDRRNAPDDFFAAEAASLRWLRDAGAPVVGVASVGDDHIELTRLASAAPSASAAEHFGAALADMHAAGAPAFGSPPEGFTGQQYIGNQPLSSTTHSSWGVFYAEERILPFLDVAVSRRNVSGADAEVVRAVCADLSAGDFDDDEPPARIHGDLWTGNVMWTPDGVVMIDPAAHGAHRETDLAMLALFGCPHLESVFAGYAGRWPLRGGWRRRIPLHQLHPLAVHAASHGPSYGRELGRAARQVRAPEA